MVAEKFRWSGRSWEVTHFLSPGELPLLGAEWFNPRYPPTGLTFNAADARIALRPTIIPPGQ